MRKGILGGVDRVEVEVYPRRSGGDFSRFALQEKAATASAHINPRSHKLRNLDEPSSRNWAGMTGVSQQIEFEIVFLEKRLLPS